MTDLLRHVCEVCGRDEILPVDDAYRVGWDYPPKMGAFGIVSPRICPDCPIDKTVWWALMIDKRADDLSPQQMVTLKRIDGEPGTIEVG